MGSGFVMINTENTHFPSSDDITFDSLEYLFGTAPALEAEKNIPWVEIEPLSKVAERQTSLEYERKLVFLEKQLQHSARQSQRLCMLIGYLQGVMKDKDEQLKCISDLRFQAGLAVARKLEAERCKEKILELEDIIEQLKQRNIYKPEKMFQMLAAPFSSDEAAVSILSWLGFINLSVILLTILHGF